MLNIYKTKGMKKHLDDDFYNPHYNKHKIANKHMLVCGPTGTGKSNYLVNLFIQMQDTFRKVIIVTKQQDEPIYAMLQEKLKEGCEITTIEELDGLKELPKIGQQLIVFDDFCNIKNQSKLEDYVIRARKYGIMCCFLTQSFFATSKIIRQNCGYLVLLTLCSQRDLGLITSTIGCALDKSVIRTLIHNATRFKMNVCIIDITNSNLNEKFRRNFTDFYQLVDDDGNQLDNVVLFSNNGLMN